MRLIDAEMIKIPTSMIHNIGGCYMVRVEDVQRIISGQPTYLMRDQEEAAGKWNKRGGEDGAEEWDGTQDTE